MTLQTVPPQSAATLERRALMSGGTSHDAIYLSVADALRATSSSGRIVDVGCGRGAMWPLVRTMFDSYLGIDGVRYDTFPRSVPLVRADLDGAIPLADASVDVALSVETIEHLENPRAFVRELARITRAGGWIVISTPNQLSAMSLMTLVTRQRFASFQDVHYPAHRSALLEVDLRRIAAEAGLEAIGVRYNLAGRMPLTARHYPRVIARLSPRLFSDTVIVTARKPARP